VDASGAGGGSAAISIKGVGCRFGSTHALDIVDLDIEAGSFVALVGPSGCGKTTLLRIVADLVSPTMGAVHIGKAPAAVARRERRLGLVSQRPAVLPWKRAIEDVVFTQRLTGRSSLPAQRMLRDFGLAGHEGKMAHQLSGGMLQRVNFASAIAHDPDVLLMDEPFSALDEMTREDLGIWLGETLAQRPKTVLFVTHHIDEAVILADRVIVMSPAPGRVLADIAIPAARPRRRDFRTDPFFVAVTARIRELLFDRVRAFSSEVATGSREENASKYGDRAPFRFNRNGKGSMGAE
jgi:NitT/TauT family transport system ATP-binding protein